MIKKDKILSELKFFLVKYTLIVMLVIIPFIFSSCKAVSSNNTQEPQLTIPSKSERRTKKADFGTITKTIKAGGTIVSGKQEDLSFKIGDYNLKRINGFQGQSVKKGQVLAELESSDIENELNEQEIKLKIAELELEKLKASNANSYDIKMAHLDVEICKVEIKKLKDKLSKTKLVANMNGIISYMCNIKLGEPVPQYKTIFTIADTENLMIAYSGKYVDSLKIGMNVKVDYKGKISDCKVISNPYKLYNSNKIEAYISGNDLHESARVGDNVKFYVELEKRENILKVPLSAVHKFNDTLYIYVMENGAEVEKTVDVGITDNIEIEIIKGLKEGEEVIID